VKLGITRRRLSLSVLVLLVACGGANGGDLFGGGGGDGGPSSGGDASAQGDGANGVDGATTDGSKIDGNTSNTDGSSGSDGATEGGGGKDAGDAGDGGIVSVDSGCGDTTASNSNCGACGYKCVHNRTCVASRCAPAWQTIAAVNEPSPRTAHAAVGFGAKFYTFGGTASLGGTTALDNGGIYDPAADSWDVTLPALKNARCFHAAVANGTDIMTFGGLTSCADPTSVGPQLEDFDGAMWTQINKGMPPDPRSGIPNIWTGTAFFVYGGASSGIALSSGAEYTPGGGTPWSDTSCALLGCARSGAFTGFVDGNKVRIFGGGALAGGLQYDLTLKTWASWTTPTGTPAAPHRTADSGTRFFVLTPSVATCPQSVSVKIYDKTKGTWTTDTAASPSGLNSDAASAWVGAELIAWSGDCGNGSSTVGGRYQPPAP
jgi:hypothetical protein